MFCSTEKVCAEDTDTGFPVHRQISDSTRCWVSCHTRVTVLNSQFVTENKNREWYVETRKC